MFFRRLGYTTGALLLILLLLNLPLGVAFWWRDRTLSLPLRQRATGPGAPDFSHRKIATVHKKTLLAKHQRQENWLDLRAFEEIDSKIIREVLDEHWLRAGIAFAPYRQHAEKPSRGRWVNVSRDQKGFAVRWNKSTPPQGEAEVLFFGGSTTFGSNIADHWTIPAYLEQSLQGPQVRNYGQSGYSWFQESLLFQEMLSVGYRPKVAIFLDGVNYHFHEGANNIPLWSSDLGTMLRNAEAPPWLLLPKQVPIFRLINYLRSRWYHHQFPPQKNDFLEPTRIKASYLNTMKQTEALAKAHGVIPLFLWQPHRAYRCHTEKYRRVLGSPEVYALYDRMEKVKRPQFVNLSHLCEEFGYERRGIIDDVHYSPQFSKFIAEKITPYVRTALKASAKTAGLQKS